MLDILSHFSLPMPRTHAKKMEHRINIDDVSTFLLLLESDLESKQVSLAGNLLKKQFVVARYF